MGTNCRVSSAYGPSEPWIRTAGTVFSIPEFPDEAGWPWVVAHPGTGWPEAVARLRLPQNVACRFPALRSSRVVSQHGIALQLPIGKPQLGTL